MTDPLFQTAPGFDQPIAVLKHCHDRIRKQIRTLQNLAAHVPQHGADLQAQQGAAAVLRYFEQAAPNHHADEEQDLLPMLQVTAVDDDAVLLHRLLPEITEEHQQMDLLWRELAMQLHAIAAGTSAALSGADVTRFAALYTAHMEKEEMNIAPMAKRIFSAEQMRALGQAMAARRGLAAQDKIGS